MQELGDFRVAGEMHGSEIVQANNSRQTARTLNSDTVVKHFDLNVCAFNAVITVSNCIDDAFLPSKFRIFGSGNKATVVTESSAFLDLTSDEIQRLPNNIENATVEGFILYDIHLRADFGFYTVITDKANSCTREKSLRIFAEQKQGSSA